MPPDTADAWHRLHHDLMHPVTAIIGHMQLLQRRVLRADGLSTLERDLMLDGLASIMLDCQLLTERMHRLLPDEPLPSPD